MAEQLLSPRWGYASITDKISDIVLHRPTRWLWGAGFLVTALGAAAVTRPARHPAAATT